MILTLLHVIPLSLAAAGQSPEPSTVSGWVEITPIALAVGPSETRQSISDGLASEFVMAPPTQISSTGYRVLPDGRLVMECRTLAVSNLQGSVRESRDGTEMQR